jgi:GTP-binding protein
VVNKVDKENCRPDEVHESVFDLMFNLDATEEQLEFHTLYGSAKNNWMGPDWQNPTDSILPLLDAIIEITFLNQKLKKVRFKCRSPHLITQLRRPYSHRKGKKRNYHRKCPIDAYAKLMVYFKKVRVKELHVFEGLGKNKVSDRNAGDICAVTGIEDFEIGDTIADVENPEPLPRISIDEPTMNMLFTINNSPFFGKEGKFVTSRHLRDRLMKEKWRKTWL